MYFSEKKVVKPVDADSAYTYNSNQTVLYIVLLSSVRLIWF